MDPGADAPGASRPEEPQPSGSGDPAPPAEHQPAPPPPQQQPQPQPSSSSPPQPSRYESQKRRDWKSFLQYLKEHKPPLSLARCSGAHVTEYLKYLDQFGKTKVHNQGCNYFGHPNPPAPCACPLRQAWGSLDALIGRLRAAYEENGGRPESNPFGTKAVRIYLREVRESQATARGIPYEKKKRKRSTTAAAAAAASSASSVTVAEGSSSAAATEAETDTSAAAGGEGGNGDEGAPPTAVGDPTPTTPPPPPPPPPPPTTTSAS